MKKISVIIPVYNTEKYLKKCLDSVVNQTYTNIEIVIINDDSTDNSEKIIKRYIDKYPNIIKYYKTGNNGVAISRNLGVEYCSGDYFCFVDSDDFLDLDLLEILSDYISKDIDLIKYKTKIVDMNFNMLHKVDGPIFDTTTGETAFNKLCFKDTLIDTPCLYLFNSTFYKNNSFKFLPNTYHEDFGLIPLIILKANTFTSTNIYGYNYVQASNSITRHCNYEKTKKKCFDLLKHYDNMIRTIPNYKIEITTQNNIKLYYTNAILSAIKILNNKDKKLYNEEINQRKLTHNIKVNNFKKLLKKAYVKLYLKTI